MIIAVDRRSGMLPYAVGGDAERVLGDGDYGRVGVYGEGLGAHVWDRGAHDKGRFQDRPGLALGGSFQKSCSRDERRGCGGDQPHGHVQDVFRIRHSAVAHFEIVEIVPSARLGFADDSGIFVEDVHHRAVETGKAAIVGRAWAAGIWTVEGIVDVATHAPAVGYGTGPVPGVVLTPIAERVQNRSSCSPV